jgi:hypothetical protein
LEGTELWFAISGWMSNDSLALSLTSLRLKQNKLAEEVFSQMA